MDEALRALGRAAASGDDEARAAHLRARLRAGELEPARVELAAWLGDRAALLTVGPPAVAPPDGLDAWVRALGRWGLEAMAIGVIAAGRAVQASAAPLPDLRFPCPVDGQLVNVSGPTCGHGPAHAPELAEDWLLCPCAACERPLRLAQWFPPFGEAPARAAATDRLLAWCLGAEASRHGLTLRAVGSDVAVEAARLFARAAQGGRRLAALLAAARLGHPPARTAVGGDGPSWLGPELETRRALAAFRHVVIVTDAPLRVRGLLTAVDAWLDCPCDDHQQRVEAASVELGAQPGDDLAASNTRFAGRELAFVCRGTGRPANVVDLATAALHAHRTGRPYAFASPDERTPTRAALEEAVRTDLLPIILAELA